MTKVVIVLIGNGLFFGILGLIWYLGKVVVPKWEAKQIARQKELKELYAKSMEERAEEQSEG